MTDGPGEPGFQDLDAELGGGAGPAGPQPIEAADGSALASLRDRRKKVVEALHFDLEVPRYDPPVYVRFKPVDTARVEEFQLRVSKSREKNRTVAVNAMVLADACMGVFEVIDGTEVSVDPDDRDGEWPKFDQRLARILDVPVKKATDVVRSLYLTDGDLISTAQDLSLRSGYAQEQLERDDPGN